MHNMGLHNGTNLQSHVVAISIGGSHSEEGAIQIIRTHLYEENHTPMKGQ